MNKLYLNEFRARQSKGLDVRLPLKDIKQLFDDEDHKQLNVNREYFYHLDIEKILKIK